MDFGKLLTRAWEIIWTNKVLWIFGILAGCGGQTQSSAFRGGSNYSTGGGYTNPPVEELPPELEPFIGPFIRLLKNNAGQIGMLFLLLCAAIILLSIVFFILRTIGRIGLIQGTLQAEAGSSNLTFGGLWQSAKPFIGRALGLNLLIAAAFFGVAAFFGIFLMIPLVNFCFLPLICLFIPVLWALQIVVKQSNIALVAEDLQILEALERGWKLVRDNIGNALLVGLILVVGLGMVSFIISLPIFMALAPLFTIIFYGASSGFDQTIFGSMGMAAICILAYTPVLMVINGIIQSYVGSSWTLAYMEFSGLDAGSISKIEPSVVEPA